MMRILRLMVEMNEVWELRVGKLFACLRDIEKYNADS